MTFKKKIKEMQAGNRKIFDELIAEFEAQLIDLLERSGLPRDDRNDVFQEMIVNVWESRQIFVCKEGAGDADVRLDFLKWIQKILKWKKGDAWRRIRRQQKYLSYNLDSNGTPMSRANQPDKDFNVFANNNDFLYPWEQERFLKKLPAFLSPEEKELLVLRYFEQRSWQEIEEVMTAGARRISQTALRKRHQRIIGKLRDNALPPEKADTLS